MNNTSNNNMQMDKMMRNFIQLEGKNQIQREYYSFLIYTTHNFKVLYFDEVLYSSTKFDSDIIDQDSYLKDINIIPICGSMFNIYYYEDGMILYGIRKLSNFVQMSLAKLVIQTIQVMSLWLFSKLNITVLLHD